MFHRVKPEAEQDEQTTQNEAPQEQSEGSEAAVKEFKPSMPQNTDEAEQNKPETRSQTQPSTQKKETDSMTEQAQDTQKEEEINEVQEEQSPSESVPGSTYQRSPARASGAYPGAYPGSYGASGSDASGSNDRRLTIGAGITMSGEIESCDHLLVEGTVEAALKGANELDIAESGVFYGTVEIEDATIAGRFEGEITAHGRITIRSTGTITGTISYKELEVEAGAVIDGKLTPIVAAQSSQAKQPQAARPKAAPPVKAKEVKGPAEERPAPANTDGELFGGKTAAAAE